MNKNSCKKLTLAKGEMNVYSYDGMKLHAYRSNDFLEDEVFILERAGKAVVIEAPCFTDNIRELRDYLAENKLDVAGLLLSYHMAGASFLPGVPVYATANADAYGHSGGGAALVNRFADAFGDAFDSGIFRVTNLIEEGPLTLGGISFTVVETPEAYDLIIPQINAVYTHMLGHDCHSIVAGKEHADAMIARLHGYEQAGYELILTSHYTPEDLKDVAAKIAYLETLKAIAEDCGSADAFKAAVASRYPEYSGENYLDMSAGLFFA